jgi:hypothetical protein
MNVFYDSANSEEDIDAKNDTDENYNKLEVMELPNNKVLLVDKELYDYIQMLPTQLINHLYIRCMREYWKQYIPKTSKIPSWYPRAVKQQNILFEARQKNIHFLHLSCNTLEQYKKYIIGCQCSYCLNVSEQTRLTELIKYELSSDYFMSSLPDTSTIWNDIIEYIIDIDTNEVHLALPIFSPDYESYNLRDIIHGDPILFSS